MASDDDSRPAGYEIEVFDTRNDNNLGSVRFPPTCPVEQCKTVRIGLPAMMVISAIVPFVIVTCMHIAYALSCSAQYTAGVAAGMILLNIICILPFISWFAFVALFVWLVVCFARRSQDSRCATMMNHQRREIFARDEIPRTHRAAAATVPEAATATEAAPRPSGADVDSQGSGSTTSSAADPGPAAPGEESRSSLSSLLDGSSQIDMYSQSSTSLAEVEDAATHSSFDSSFSESSLNDFTPNWRSPV